MTSTLAGGVKHPKIYAYTTPAHAKTKWAGGRAGEGLVKVGFTDNESTEAVETCNCMGEQINDG